MNNGAHLSTVVDQAIQLAEDHLRLVRLECLYESAQSKRRLGFFGLAVLCALGAYIYTQIAIISALARAGIPVYISSIAFAFLHAALGLYLYQKGGRNPAAGEPFEGSHQELKRSLQWIHQLLS